MKYEKILKERYGLNNYQLAQLRYVFKTLFSEISKFLIMLILFHEKFPLFLCTVTLLCLMRITSGGFHCNTYIGCLIFSVTYMILCINILPRLYFEKIVRLVFTVICIFINYFFAPVSSEKHVPLNNSARYKYKLLSTAILTFYLIIMLIVPDNQFFITGFWVIILHIVQLLLAVIHKKICTKQLNMPVQERSI